MSIGMVTWETPERAPMAKAKGSQPDDSTKTLLSIKGKPSWYLWLKEYADSLGMDAVGAIDNALRQQAKRDEFPKPMPKRMGR